VSLKPQDLCILLKIVALGRVPWSYSQLAFELAMSASEAHAGVKRAVGASLMRIEEGWGYPDPCALEEFLVHGVKYVFAPGRGGLVRGIPTAHAAPPLSRLVEHNGEAPPVWPDEAGEVRGYEFAPLYKSVPQAARRDRRLYELLALVDAIRGGGERELAVSELRFRLAAAAESIAGSTPCVDARAALKNATRGAHGQERQRLHRGRH
jgi:hypothetical protein